MVPWRTRIASPGSAETYEEKMVQGSFDLSKSIICESVEEIIIQTHLFFTIICFLVMTRGKHFFWMDIVCIDQDNQSEKEFFVPKMSSLYRCAAETHAYLTGSRLAPTLFCDAVYFPDRTVRRLRGDRNMHPTWHVHRR
ncbi:hypothetical protein B0H21DRAFT_757387 [Amylocystis lapponica]|nr:hypothetical protein B0H21DRAFT_757387 [Amylocystis lapponica]